jgi:hypothetical protein
MRENIMIPEIKKNVLSMEDFNALRNSLKEKVITEGGQYDDRGRKIFSPQIVNECAEKLVPFAREFFKSDTLLHSYSLFAEYSDKNISLPKHKDGNACTYTIDMVLYQDKPWGIWIEGKEYLLNENEAVLFWGTEQEHWRETIEDNNNTVAVIFFHYVEPDHWWFTKGPDYINVLINQKKESSN